VGAVSPESISRNARLHLLQARVFASVYCNEALSFLFVPARKIRMAHFISKLPAQPLPTSWWMECGFVVQTITNLPDKAAFLSKRILVPDSTENLSTKPKKILQRGKDFLCQNKTKIRLQ